MFSNDLREHSSTKMKEDTDFFLFVFIYSFELVLNETMITIIVLNNNHILIFNYVILLYPIYLLTTYFLSLRISKYRL